MEDSRDSEEAGFSDVFSHLLRFFGATVVLTVVSWFGIPLAAVGQDALEETRQHLIERRFEEALPSAEAAAAALGLEPAYRYHPDMDAQAGGDTASVHLYRGLALELNRQFPEARADYDAFLAIEPDSWRAAELLKRYPYVNGQAVRSDARKLRDDAEVPDGTVAKYGVGVFPLYNTSTILVMSQVAFGLTGVLTNTLGLLDHFSDDTIPVLPYSELRLLLDEVIPEEVYGTGSTIDVGSLARVLQSEYLASGVLDEVSGSLTGEVSVGKYDDLSSMTLGDLQANYTPIGLLDLQRELSLAIADSIQSQTGFQYVPSRQAYADSLESLLIDDVGTLLTYGYAVEQLVLGEPVEAQALMMDLREPVAAEDLAHIDQIVASSTPPVDNLLILTGLTAPFVAVMPPTDEVEPVAGDTTAVEPDTTLSVEPAAVLTLDDDGSVETRTAHVVSAAAARHLSGFSLWGPTVRTNMFDGLQRDDPRRGVAGTLDPTRSSTGEPGIDIEVVIPLPTGNDRSGATGK